MLRLIDTLYSTLAPHYCLGCDQIGLLLCSSCIELLPDVQPCCYKCRRLSPEWSTCKKCRSSSPLASVVVVTHYESVAENLLHKLKFERANAAAIPIAIAMHRVMPMEKPHIVPVPTATSRVRIRGYDQSSLIARELSTLSEGQVFEILRRIGQQRQTGSPRKVRLSQLHNSFETKQNSTAQVSEVVLVDDVLTTGSTLEAAARRLKNHGVKKVRAVVFARAD